MHAEPQLAAATRERAGGFVGQRMERFEDSALLRGRGAFADDLGVKAGTLHAAVLRSPHAHARLTAIRIDAALAVKGVRAVLTGADVQRWAQPFVVGVKQPMQHWALAVDRVRHVGEPVAVVVAEDRYIAEDALDLIAADYEPLPVVMEIAQALRADAPLLHEAVDSNIVSDRSFRYGDPESAFASARRVQTTVHFPRIRAARGGLGFKPIELFQHFHGDPHHVVLKLEHRLRIMNEDIRVEYVVLGGVDIGLFNGHGFWVFQERGGSGTWLGERVR